MVQRLFRLRRRIENHDWDFEYNRQHPTEEPRQKDPDISYEEYAEKRLQLNRDLEKEIAEKLPYLESREIKKIVIQFSKEEDKMN